MKSPFYEDPQENADPLHAKMLVNLGMVSFNPFNFFGEIMVSAFKKPHHVHDSRVQAKATEPITKGN